MLEWLELHGTDLLSIIISAGALAGAIYNFVKVIKLGNRTTTTLLNFGSQIDITKEAIVEGFKAARIPNELKVSLGNKLDAALDKATTKLIEIVQKNEEQRTLMMTKILKILSYTAAANKLTDEETAQINDMIRLIDDSENTIEV